MIRRVIGKANGFDIIFEKGEGDWWNIAIPSDLSGEYVVEVYAEDEAGNSDYLCRMLFSVCGHELQVQVLDGRLGINILDSGITAEKTGDSYRADVQEGGYRCERIICSRDGH